MIKLNESLRAFSIDVMARAFVHPGFVTLLECVELVLLLIPLIVPSYEWVGQCSSLRSTLLWISDMVAPSNRIVFNADIDFQVDDVRCAVLSFQNGYHYKLLAIKPTSDTYQFIEIIWKVGPTSKYKATLLRRENSERGEACLSPQRMKLITILVWHQINTTWA